MSEQPPPVGDQPFDEEPTSVQPGTGATTPGTGATAPGTGATAPGTGATTPGAAPPQPSAGYYAQPGGYAIPPEHPEATMVLVLGILGIVVCPLTAPFAWIMGNRVVREIDESHGRLGGRSNANAGRICGLVMSWLMIASVVLTIVIAAVVLAVVAGTSS